MNIILKNTLVGCAIIGVCFGLGRGVKWLQNYDWSVKSSGETQIEQKAYDDQQYWTKDLRVIHMGQKCSIQNMVRGNGYCAAGDAIC